MDLFEYMRENTKEKESPLASRLRPTKLEEVVGQQHIIGKDKLLYRAIRADKLSSIIFYGPSGTGKTTLAKVIANTTSAEFMQMNATIAGKKDMEAVIEQAKNNLGMYGKRTILFIDEIHRFNKGQQDYLLPFVEDGTVILIGATTENPYFEVNGALISRSSVFELKPLEREDIKILLKRAVYDTEKGMGTYRAEIDEDALEFLSDISGGDARNGGFVVLKSNAAQFRGGSGAGDAAKDGTYNSMLGMPRTSISKAGVRPFCKNGTHHGAYRVYNEIAWLQRVEYASLHCQDTYTETLTADGFHQGGLGSGCAVDGGQWNTWGGYRPFVPCGVTATLGNNTGKVSYTIKGWTGGDKVVQVTSYRGLETPYEYLWLLADDVLVWHKADVSIAYVCEDPTKFTSHSDGATTVPTGYEAITELPRTDGYVLSMAHSAKGYSFAEKVGGASNKGYCDYFYTCVDDSGWSTPGWYGALLSANAHYGAGAGFGSLYTGSRSSSAGAYNGFRLCRF